MLKYCDNPEYVLHHAHECEWQIYIEKYFEARKERWEQTRFIAYMIAQVNSKKKLSPKDIMQFSWENEHKSEKEDPQTRERILKQMEAIEKYMNNERST